MVTVGGPEAMQWSHKLAQQEGIFTGISAGGTVAAARKIAATAPVGSTILAMLPDTGERYLSTPLFEKIESVMTEDEAELMRSIPRYRFDPPKVRGQDLDRFEPPRADRRGVRERCGNECALSWD